MAKVYLIYIDINTGYFPGLHHGLASLAAAIRHGGHNLRFHHLSVEEPYDSICDKVNQFQPDIIGFSVTTNQKMYLGKYSDAIYKKNKAPQVVGGVHATVAPDDAFSLSAIQGVCVGEGEQSFVGLLNKLDTQSSLLDTPGFWWRAAGRDIQKNPVPELIRDLSDLPYPDYSIFDTKTINERNSGWMDMMVTRGCPYSCFYCCNHALRSIYPNKEDYVRFAPVKHAIGIIKHNLSIHPGVKGITFSDDLLVLNKKWFKEFMDIYSREIKLPFICNARVEHLTEEICALLKQGNCACVRIGLESGSEWVRKNILNRQMSNEQIIRAFSLLKKFKIPTFSFNIIGFPFETKELMRQTLLLNKRIKPEWGMVYYFYPYPGTQIYSICEKFGLLDKSSNELSSYLEGPAINLSHCTLGDCRKFYYKIRFYLLSRFVTKDIKLFRNLFQMIIYLFFNLHPAFFAKIFTKKTKIKQVLRKIGYNKMLR